MAPEMATMGGIQCSTKGDVYSFGILLYSTWSRTKPYGDQGMNPFQLVRLFELVICWEVALTCCRFCFMQMTAVVNGLRPVIPINCPPGLARLMRVCWESSPDLRPTFPEISLLLKDPTLLSTGTDEYLYPGTDLASSSMLSSAPSSAPTSVASFRRSSRDRVSPQGPPPDAGFSEDDDQSDDETVALLAQ